MEIEIKVRSTWDEEELAKRIARIVSYTDAECSQKSSHSAYGGYKWQLNQSGNDWWMTEMQDVPDQKYKIVKIAYRYGFGHQKMMEALQVFLQWEVGFNEN